MVPAGALGAFLGMLAAQPVCDRAGPLRVLVERVAAPPPR